MDDLIFSFSSFLTLIDSKGSVKWDHSKYELGRERENMRDEIYVITGYYIRDVGGINGLKQDPKKWKSDLFYSIFI